MSGSQVTVIAEMAWAHDGSVDKALRIMRGARAAGADAVGIHVTSLPDYMSRHYGNGKQKVSAGKEHLDIVEYLARINLGPQDWIRFAAEAGREGIRLCVMANDLPSVEFVDAALKPHWYVVSAGSFVEEELVRAVARRQRPTLFRTGGATLGEIERAVELFRAESTAELVLLHGFQNYPTRLEELHVKQLRTLSRMFGTPVGLADHLDGADPIARTVPAVALACGATYIEKHITWDRRERGEDFESALDPEGFAEFVRNLRAAETALGQEGWLPLSPAALSYRRISRKRTVAARALAAGAVLTPADFCFKRSDEGVAPNEAGGLVGRRLARALGPDDPVTWEVLM